MLFHGYGVLIVMIAISDKQQIYKQKLIANVLLMSDY